MTDDEFEHRVRIASQRAKERSKGLSKVRENVLRLFKDRYPLVEFFLLDQQDVDFRAYVFWGTDSDITRLADTPAEEELRAAIAEQLASAGRGENLTIAFEFDSDENVQRTCDGDYLMRLK